MDFMKVKLFDNKTNYQNRLISDIIYIKSNSTEIASISDRMH